MGIHFDIKPTVITLFESVFVLHPNKYYERRKKKSEQINNGKHSCDFPAGKLKAVFKKTDFHIHKAFTYK